MDEKKLLNFVLELIYKSNSLIDIIDSNDELRFIEMSINRTDILCKNTKFNSMFVVDKSKLIIIRLDKLYFVLPLTITKVETKLRNVIINEKPKLEGLAKFMEFYLATFCSPIATPVQESMASRSQQI